MAAYRVVAYLAAAGVGWIAADATLRAAVDPAHPDARVGLLADVTTVLDAAIVVAPSVTSAYETVGAWRAGATLWIADGLAGACPPCPRCAAGATTRAATPVDLVALRDALLGTVIATETVKVLLAIGAPLAGRVLAYDPVTATVASEAATARPDCGCARV